jgi:pyruvate/2-oxoglutarate dehydrogenase complex dihydrolipoamide acyltransferase (E2) component
VKKLLVPRLNPNDNELELSLWLKGDGDAVKAGEPVCEFTSSKAACSFEAPAAGFLRREAGQGARLAPGTPFASLCATDAEALAPPAAGGPAMGSAAPVFSRKALEKLRELGLREGDFSGFVTEKMVLARRGGSALPLLKEKEIEALTPAYREALRGSLTVRIPLGALLAKADSEAVPPQACFACAAARALGAHRRFLLAFGEAGEPAVDLGYAVDVGTGLRLFLARGADAWNASTWAERIADWGMRLLRHEVKPEELGTGLFSVTDLSGQGVTTFEPLLVGRQSAILGFGGELDGPAPEAYATLAFDHRVHDGRQGAVFLRDLKERLSRPESLFA